MSEEIDKKQQKTLAKEERKNRRARRIASFRHLKNFGWWLFGFLSSFVIVAGTAAVCITLIPANTLLGKNHADYIDEETGESTILQILQNYSDYSVSNFPINQKALENALSSSGLDQYMEIDYQKLSEVKFSDVNFENIFNNCITITATIENLGVTSSLGDLAKLKVMTENTPADLPDTSDPSFDPTIYYYLDNNNNLKCAYKTDKTMVKEAEGKQLYFPALLRVPLDKMIQLLPTRMGQEEVVDLLSIFTNIQDGSLLKKIFDGYTVNGLGSFDPNTILISDILTLSDENKTLFDILCAASVVGEGEEEPTPETLKIGNLNNIDINKVHIVDIVAPNEENEDIFAILRDATGKGQNEEITVGDIAKANLDDVKLSSLIPDDDAHHSLCTILASATGKASYDEVSLNDLSSFDANNILLKDAMPSLEETLKDVLIKGCNVSSFEVLKIGDLSSFDMNAIPLSLLLKEDGNQTLTKILLQATGKTSYSDVLVGDLTSDFDINRITLKTVIGENENLFDILTQATGKGEEELKVSDLSSFDISNVRLNTIIKDKTNNQLLDKLLSQDDVTISNIGQKINEMRIYDIYGENCWTSDSSNSTIPLDAYSFDKDTKTYTYVPETDRVTGGEYYYVSKNSGILLLLSYDVTLKDDTNGRAKTYTPSTYRYVDLENGSASTDIVRNATVYQLIATGFLSDRNSEGKAYSDNLKRMTIKQLIDLADQIPSSYFHS
ncbi:MAG TPA: hypothetical protein DD384_06265 [Firmicutes bacterium]|nr:hypothetical protein [Bacillota bacterium]